MAQAELFAVQTGGRVVAVTFEPHPLQIVTPNRAPERLMTLDEKTSCLAHLGVDVTVVLQSEPGLLGMEPENFVERIIVDSFAPTHVVEGRSFGFGKGRRGTVDLLQQMGRRHGFEMFVVDPVTVQVKGGETVFVSSSLVRQLLREGRVHEARLCLGRPYRLTGVVQHGHGRGVEFGFPTANLGQIEQMIPAEGVYAGLAIVNEQSWPSAISVGTAPTFGDNRMQVEAHLLKGGRDFTGERIRLSFGEWIRAQQRFASAEQLKEQIRQDVSRVHQWVEASRDWIES